MYPTACSFLVTEIAFYHHPTHSQWHNCPSSQICASCITQVEGSNCVSMSGIKIGLSQLFYKNTEINILNIPSRHLNSPQNCFWWCQLRHIFPSVGYILHLIKLKLCWVDSNLDLLSAPHHQIILWKLLMLHKSLPATPNQWIYLKSCTPVEL